MYANGIFKKNEFPVKEWTTGIYHSAKKKKILSKKRKPLVGDLIFFTLSNKHKDSNQILIGVIENVLKSAIYFIAPVDSVVVRGKAILKKQKERKGDTQLIPCEWIEDSQKVKSKKSKKKTKVTLKRLPCYAGELFEGTVDIRKLK